MLEKKVLDYTILSRLTQAFGPSGREKEIAALLASYSRDYADSVHTDGMGNLIVHKSGSGKKIMVAAHMDEVGVIVTHIDKNGYLYFSPVGGVKEADLLAKRVVFDNGLTGVVGRERKTNAEGKPVGKYFIDIAVCDEQEARQKIREGDMAVLAGPFVENDSHVISKALDNRAGCFVALEALKQYRGDSDLYFVFTAQEEVGLRGAKTAACTLVPDLALVVDTTISYDTPKEEYRTSINKGAAIKVMDRTIIVSPEIKNWMTKTAQKVGLNYQYEVITAGGTDSGPIHLSKGGIPTGGIAIPVRYLHSGSEIAAKSDLESACKLLAALLEDPYAAEEPFINSR